MKKSIGETKISEYLKPTLSRVLITFILSIGLALLFIFMIPFSRETFLKQALSSKIIDLIFNGIIYSVLIYPWICLIILAIKRKTR